MWLFSIVIKLVQEMPAKAEKNTFTRCFWWRIAVKSVCNSKRRFKVIVPVVLIVLRLAMYMWIILAFLNRFFFSFAELTHPACVLFIAYLLVHFIRGIYI